MTPRPARLSGWALAASLIALLVVIPVSAVLVSLLSPEKDIWGHLVEHVLNELVVNTFWLVLGVGLGTVVLGVSLAWLTTACEFPGRGMFSWALLLPLAMPAYVTGFVAIGLLDFTGPLQTQLRAWFGQIWFPPIRSRGGVIAVMTLALYPYVYLIARNAFVTQGKRALETAQSLGHSRISGFFRVSLPMARPWIVGGVMLAMMETLADFGTVSVFNYDTFTTGIYKAWFSLFSLPAASQLASILIMIVFAMLLIEQQTRSRMRYTQAGWRAAPHDRIELRGPAGWLAFAYSALVLMLAFIIPFAQLLQWAATVISRDFDERYLSFLGHSLFLSGIATALVIVVALILSYAGRRHTGLQTRIAAKIATLGYALPGPVLAVGIVIPIAWLDNQLIHAAKAVFAMDTGLVLQGTLLVMLLAYLVRFLAVGFHPIDSNMQRMTRSIDEASQICGVSGVNMLRRVHLPILRGGIFTAATLVFVDVMKEMPITLMTRPFGWDTLAVRIFEMTSEGEWERAALPAVALVLAGLMPMILLTRRAEQ